jgi:FtsZ-interacting cell division protein ZipA
MDASMVLVGAMALVGTLSGVVFAAWTARRSQKSTDQHAGYDQIQEDLKEMRAERKSDREAAIAERTKDRAEMTHLQNLVRHLDDEVVGLRADIQSGRVPPLGPRPIWPERPDQS